ncbi:MAG: AMP-binding protein [Gammaproteobacteria bacterium]|nr:AMP-binding protein [Gammaproteobacteria bacterium]
MSAVVDAIRRHAATMPSASALVDANERVGYAELAARVEEWSVVLRRHRVGTFALAAGNRPAWVIADVAALNTGASVVPVPDFFSPAQLRHVLRDSGADAMLADAASAAAGICLGAEPLAALPDGMRLLRLRPAPDAAPPRDAVRISYTSGTTGEPKGARLPIATLESVAESVREATRAVDVRRHLCLLPLPTLLENVAGVYAPLLAGAEVAVPGSAETGLVGSARLDALRLLTCIGSYRPHSIIVVPQMLDALVRVIEGGGARPESLRFIAVGGAHTSQSLLERAERCGLPVYEGYGLTECGSVVALNTPGARRVGSVGRPLAHARVRVDESGEIVVSGAVMSGYTHQSAAAGSGDAPYSGGGGAVAEVRTGDLGRLDPDGFLYVHGRRRNVFITSFGRNVSPEWVEAALGSSPHIAQAALFGEARPWNVAVLVPMPGATEADIDAHVEKVNAELPDYARVGQWITASEPFSAANGLSTANGRPRRERILRRYRVRIDRCYDELLTDIPRSHA